MSPLAGASSYDWLPLWQLAKATFTLCSNNLSNMTIIFLKSDSSLTTILWVSSVMFKNYQVAGGISSIYKLPSNAKDTMHPLYFLAANWLRSTSITKYGSTDGSSQGFTHSGELPQRKVNSPGTERKKGLIIKPLNHFIYYFSMVKTRHLNEHRSCRETVKR